MTYATCYIVRFQGTLTQGPNAGRSYTWQSSWGGAFHHTPEQAFALVSKYRTLEPTLEMKVFSRQYVDGRPKGRFVETEITDPTES